MTFLAAGLEKIVSEGLGQQIIEKAKSIVAEILLPKEITGKIIQNYIRKAMRTGKWRTLAKEAKALLLVAKRLPQIKSLTLKDLLFKIFLEIELKTFQGQAYFHGALIALISPIHRINELLYRPKKLLILGIFQLNTPPLYRPM